VTHLISAVALLLLGLIGNSRLRASTGSDSPTFGNAIRITGALAVIDKLSTIGLGEPPSAELSR